MVFPHFISGGASKENLIMKLNDINDIEVGIAVWFKTSDMIPLKVRYGQLFFVS